MLFGSKRLVGIDVGSRYIKLAEIDYSPKGSKLLNLAIAPTPEGAFMGAELNQPELIGSAIAGLISAEKVKNDKVAFGLYGTSVMVKKITMPKIDKKVLAQQIRWEAEQYIPFDLNQIVLAHHINERSIQPDTINVLIIAAQNTTVAQNQQIARAAGLKLEVLDLASFALANCFELGHGTQLGMNHMLVHVGAFTTHVVIVSNGEIEFVRDISLGSHSCTLEIHKEMGLSIDEAEALKVGASRGEEVPEDIFRYIESFNQSLSDEIKNSLDYFIGSQPDGSGISHIYMSGGGARMLGLVDKISSATEQQVQNFNPLAGFKSVSPKIQALGEEAIFYSPIAIGLGIRKRGDR